MSMAVIIILVLHAIFYFSDYLPKMKQSDITKTPLLITTVWREN